MPAFAAAGASDFAARHPGGWMAPLARHGDLLPLPVPHAEDCTLSGFGSRASSRRTHRQYRIHARVTETIGALHFLAGYSSRSEWPLQALNSAQSMALARIRRLHTHSVSGWLRLCPRRPCVGCYGTMLLRNMQQRDPLHPVERAWYLCQLDPSSRVTSLTFCRTLGVRCSRF